eukprot:GFKZ01013162.1.p1 GENE.GFKZ01013162.1~~GFKZ01013162.1.p1  ORF type:complete len:1384 (+),score=212.46 GFKZ01013162.1:285-4436(+)
MGVVRRTSSSDGSKDLVSHRQPCPERRANPISRVFLGWVFPLVLKGFRSPLHDEDLWELRDTERGQKTTDDLMTSWHTVTHDGKDRKPGNSLFTSVFRVTKRSSILSGFLKVIDVGLGTVQPVLIFGVLNSLQAGDSVGVSILWALSLLLVPFLKTIVENHYFLLVMRSGMRVRSGLQGAIYDKSLRMSPSARASSSLGEIVNLMQLDTQRIGDFFQFVHNLWAAPAQIIISVALLFEFIGVSAVIGLLVTLATLPAQTLLMKAMLKLRKANISVTDRRVKLMNEILQGIKAVKFYAWEVPFAAAVEKERAEELKKMKATIWLRSSFMAIIMAIPTVIAVITFAFYTGVFRQELEPARIFTGLALLNQLRAPVMMLPLTANTFIDARIGLKRIERFLRLEDTDNYSRDTPSKHSQKVDEEGSGNRTSWSDSTDNESASITITGGEFQWGSIAPPEEESSEKKKGFVSKCLPRKKRPQSTAGHNAGKNGRSSESDGHSEGDDRSSVLQDINVNMQEGELTAIVGRVGSGKSSLIHAILGEMKKVKGHVSLSGSVAYVAQTAWIFNDTLRNNIIFGKEFNEKLYRKALRVSALEQDIEILPAGDMTAIGEKGINLSGGQKQRVSIARAVYADAAVYLFDDPLSALDAHVSQEVFQKCISNNGALKKKLRVLITNQIHTLPDCDKVIFIESGAVRSQGTYEQLSSSDTSFQQLINEQRKAAEENEDEADQEENTTPEENRQSLSISAAHKSVSKSVAVSAKEQDEHAGKGEEAGKKLMQEEERVTGNVLLRAYLQYSKACGGVLTFLLMIIFWCATVALSVIANWWLVFWSEETLQEDTDRGLGFYLSIYFALGIGYAIAVMVRGIWFLNLALVASRRLQSSMLHSVLRAPMAFFDTTPIGRIISRFSRDVSALDELLPQFFQQMMSTLLNLIASYVYIGINLPLFFAVAAPVTVGYFLLQRFFNRTSVELKRLDAISKSPIYAHFSETLGGLSTLRAYGKQEQSKSDNMNMIDINQRAFFSWLVANRWFSLYLEMAGSLLIFATAVFGVMAVRSSGTFSGDVGLSLTYSLQVTGILGFTVRSITELEGQMSSVERANYYSKNLPQEAPATLTPGEGIDVPEGWPAQGQIEVEDVQMRYREGLDLVLKGVSVSIKGGEKVGVVGRTGSGKSSLMIALLRMVELSGGAIRIDGINLRDLGLNDLRKRLTIIPQDPVIFSGTIRFNLDPFNEHSDAELWDALEKSHMKEFVSEFEGGLDAVVSEYGENMSAGQRQVICLTRALLRNSNILILDEASSSLDMETDRLIQETIRTHLKHATILTIAHRLFTLADYDKIVMMDDGVVAEFASPAELLSRENSRFAALVESMGEAGAARFREMVREKTNENH